MSNSESTSTLQSTSTASLSHFPLYCMMLFGLGSSVLVAVLLFRSLEAARDQATQQWLMIALCLAPGIIMSVAIVATVFSYRQRTTDYWLRRLAAGDRDAAPLCCKWLFPPLGPHTNAADEAIGIPVWLLRRSKGYPAAKSRLVAELLRRHRSDQRIWRTMQATQPETIDSVLSALREGDPDLRQEAASFLKSIKWEPATDDDRQLLTRIEAAQQLETGRTSAVELRLEELVRERVEGLAKFVETLECGPDGSVLKIGYDQRVLSAERYFETVWPSIRDTLEQEFGPDSSSTLIIPAWSEFKKRLEETAHNIRLAQDLEILAKANSKEKALRERWDAELIHSIAEGQRELMKLNEQVAAGEITREEADREFRRSFEP